MFIYKVIFFLFYETSFDKPPFFKLTDFEKTNIAILIFIECYHMVITTRSVNRCYEKMNVLCMEMFAEFVKITFSTTTV